MKTYLTLIGEKFDPYYFEEIIKVEFENKEKSGKVGKYGKYKNKIIPYGSCDLILENKKGMNFILDFLLKNRKSFSKYGIENLFISLYIKNKTNFLLKKEEIEKIVKIKEAISITFN